jgi:isopenicillin N synthase-like dioxygenase
VTINQIKNALIHQGFFYVTNHGVSSTDLQLFLNESKRFFRDVPMEEKKRIKRKDSVVSNGYIAIGVENLDDTRPGSVDVKEALDICVSDPHPLYAHNQWPDEKYVPNWKENVFYFIETFQKVGVALTRAFSLMMGEKEDFFSRYYDQHQSTAARFIRYPPRREDSPMGCGCHSDYGTLTILLQDDIGGLQVLLNNQWVDAVPIKDTLVINVGDCTEYMSNGILKATKHRVINKSTTQERFVSVLFFEPNIDMPIETTAAFKHYPDPFPNRPKHYGNHLESRLIATMKVQ